MKETVKINLFGFIRLENGGRSLDENQIHSGRLLPLLSYLVVHREAQAQKKVLCRQVTGEEGNNPEGKLKNLIYRLRGVLKALGPEDYILTLPGGYQWNPEIPVETDYERFEELCAQLCGEQDPAQRRKLCEEAVGYYRGNFSAGIAQEEWLIPRYVEDQARYMDVTEMLGGIYETAGEWSNAEQLYRDSLAWEPYSEELHSRLIAALQRQGKYSQAAEHYENTRKFFHENLGVWPGSLKDPFDPFDGEWQEGGAWPERLAQVQARLRGAGMPKEAFFCDGGVFRDIYCLEVCRSMRTGISELLLLLTVRQPGRLPGGEKEVCADTLHGMELLEKILRKTLRAGDAVTRSSGTQFIVLLSACSYEAGILVAQRIRKGLRKEAKKLGLRLELRYELGEAAFPEEGRREAERYG